MSKEKFSCEDSVRRHTVPVPGGREIMAGESAARAAGRMRDKAERRDRAAELLDSGRSLSVTIVPPSSALRPRAWRATHECRTRRATRVESRPRDRRHPVLERPELDRLTAEAETLRSCRCTQGLGYRSDGVRCP